MDQLPAWLGNEGFVRMLEGTTYIVSIIGVPVAIVLYARSLLAEKHAREWAIYEAVQEKYMNFLDTALSRPKVGVLWTEPDVLKGELSADERIDQDLLFNILTSIFERAFLVYRRASSAQRKRQWAGWEFLHRGLRPAPQFPGMVARLCGKPRHHQSVRSRLRALFEREDRASSRVVRLRAPARVSGPARACRLRSRRSDDDGRLRPRLRPAGAHHPRRRASCSSWPCSSSSPTSSTPTARSGRRCSCGAGPNVVGPFGPAAALRRPPEVRLQGADHPGRRQQGRLPARAAGHGDAGALGLGGDPAQRRLGDRRHQCRHPLHLRHLLARRLRHHHGRLGVELEIPVPRRAALGRADGVLRGLDRLRHRSPSCSASARSTSPTSCWRRRRASAPRSACRRASSTGTGCRCCRCSSSSSSRRWPRPTGRPSIWSRPNRSSSPASWSNTPRRRSCCSCSANTSRSC